MKQTLAGFMMKEKDTTLPVSLVLLSVPLQGNTDLIKWVRTNCTTFLPNLQTTPGNIDFSLTHTDWENIPNG